MSANQALCSEGCVHPEGNLCLICTKAPCELNGTLLNMLLSNLNNQMGLPSPLQKNITDRSKDRSSLPTSSKGEMVHYEVGEEGKSSKKNRWGERE